MDIYGDIQDDITKWSSKYNTILSAVWYVYFLNALLLLTFSSLTAYIVIYQRQRYDQFAMVALVCYISSQLIYCVYTFGAYEDQNSSPAPSWLSFFHMTANFLYLAAHWAFSSQYLKTSFVLPRVLSMAQLEYKSSDAIRDSDQLNRALNRNSLELLKEVDESLVQEKIALGKIKLKMLVFNTVMILLLLAMEIFDYKKYDWINDGRIADDVD